MATCDSTSGFVIEFRDGSNFGAIFGRIFHHFRSASIGKAACSGSAKELKLIYFSIHFHTLPFIS